MVVIGFLLSGIVFEPLLIALVILVVAFLVFLISRYRKCPSDKILVIYGKIKDNKDGTPRSAKCIHGGASLVWPFF